MYILDDFIRFRTELNHIPLKEPVSISLEQIATLLCCTTRNSKFILQKWIALQWIAWIPGRGRGNRSQLSFLAEPDELVISHAQQMIYSGQVAEALSLIQKYTITLPKANERFQRWFRGQFGLQWEREQGKRIETLRLPLGEPLAIVDPIHAYLRSECHISQHICETLLRYNKTSGSMEPHLAYHIEKNESGDRWTIFLRKGVLFHHGREMLASDVIFSLNRLARENSPYQWLTREIREMIQHDDRVIEIRLTGPHHLFDRYLGNEHLAIVPKDYVEQVGEDFARMPIGTGPFKLIRNDDGLAILEAFESYFGIRPHLDRVQFIAMQTKADEMKTTYGMWYEMDEVEQKVESHREDWQRVTSDDWCVQYLSCNQRKSGPITSLSFRRALQLILSPEQMLHELGGARHETATCFASWKRDSLFLEESKRQSDLCLSERVHLLLQQSNYQGEAVRLHTFTDQDHVEDCEWIKERCAMYGLNMENHYYTVSELLQPITIEQADFIHDSATIGDDTELSLLEVFLSHNSFVYSHVKDEDRQKIKIAITHLQSLSSGVDRRKAITKIEQMLQQQIAYLPLYRNRIGLVVDPRLRGIRVNRQGHVDYRTLWYKDMS
ncbi:ABC transporter substrate-binding protein [Brevibacillus laterosporus]|uniref:ABC transporter substrate-binding protein n=1 Tax=Brevibacillus laterosporus TaxID=1465 RepID=UPI002E1BC43E|nr:ABC transporter substrate-binding protein [Brevibacillus laterosporus]